MTSSIVESNYKMLCILYISYKSIIEDIENIAKYFDSNFRVNNKLSILNFLLQKIEKYPITWKFYTQQHFKFNREFEDLVIFIDESNIYKMADR